LGLLDLIFKRPPEKKPDVEKIQGYFKLLNGYTPVFTSYSGALYEYEITRAAIHSFAVHASKLKPEISGSAYKKLGVKVQSRMNPWMDTTKFLYRLATILSVDNNAFIVPMTDGIGDTITGFFPIRPSRSEILQDTEGNLWLRYQFSSGQKAVIEFDRVGIVNQFLFDNDIFGENNNALANTLNIISTNNQGIVEGVKASASIRFMARLANIFKPEDITKERQRFIDENLGYENNNGVLMFDNKYADVKQIVSKPYTVDNEQMQSIEDNVFNYFGTNKKILQNCFTEDEWNAFYEGKIEPFGIQVSLVMTNMMFTDAEIVRGNKFLLTSNRLQYASNKTKLEVVTQMFDRGFLTHNEGLSIFNMAPVDGGDKHFIRLEYSETNKLSENNEIEGGSESDDNNEGQTL
jgi:hypothetical protein